MGWRPATSSSASSRPTIRHLRGASSRCWGPASAVNCVTAYSINRSAVGSAIVLQQPSTRTQRRRNHRLVHQRRSHVTPFVSRGETSTAVFFLVAAQRRSREPREVEQQDAHRERPRSAATERSRSEVLRRSQRWFRGFRSSCNRTMGKALPSVPQDFLHTTRCVLARHAAGSA